MTMNAITGSIKITQRPTFQTKDNVRIDLVRQTVNLFCKLECSQPTGPLGSTQLHSLDGCSCKNLLHLPIHFQTQGEIRRHTFGSA